MSVAGWKHADAQSNLASSLFSKEARNSDVPAGEPLSTRILKAARKMEIPAAHAFCTLVVALQDASRAMPIFMSSCGCLAASV